MRFASGDISWRITGRSGKPVPTHWNWRAARKEKDRRTPLYPPSSQRRRLQEGIPEGSRTDLTGQTLNRYGTLHGRRIRKAGPGSVSGRTVTAPGETSPASRVPSLSDRRAISAARAGRKDSGRRAQPGGLAWAQYTTLRGEALSLKGRLAPFICFFTSIGAETAGQVCESSGGCTTGGGRSTSRPLSGLPLRPTPTAQGALWPY